MRHACLTYLTLCLAGVFFLLVGCGAPLNLQPRPGRPAGDQRHSIKQLRDRHVVKQRLDYSCGSAALATLMIYYFGQDTSEKEILRHLFEPLSEEDRADRVRKGFSLLDLKRVANRMGYDAEGFKLSTAQLAQLSAPVIVHLEAEGYKHFAVYRGMSWRRVYLADPARGNLRMSLDRFLSEWGGIIFVLGRKDEDEIKNFPLAVPQNAEYGQPELLPFAGQMDRGLFINMLPLR